MNDYRVVVNIQLSQILAVVTSLVFTIFSCPCSGYHKKLRQTFQTISGGHLKKCEIQSPNITIIIHLCCIICNLDDIVTKHNISKLKT